MGKSVIITASSIMVQEIGFEPISLDWLPVFRHYCLLCGFKIHSRSDNSNSLELFLREAYSVFWRQYENDKLCGRLMNRINLPESNRTNSFRLSCYLVTLQGNALCLSTSCFSYRHEVERSRRLAVIVPFVSSR